MNDPSVAIDLSPPPFWLVWSEQGGVPTIKHATEQDAMNEACRLADKHRERKFHVLRSQFHVATVVVRTTLMKTVYGRDPGPEVPI